MIKERAKSIVPELTKTGLFYPLGAVIRAYTKKQRYTAIVNNPKPMTFSPK